MGKCKGFGDIKRIKQLKNKMDFYNSEGFILYTNKIDVTRIGNINMNKLSYAFTKNESKVDGVTIKEIEEYMGKRFATGGISDFKSLGQIMPLPAKALEMNINGYIERILSNKRRIELERTTYVPKELGKNVTTIDPVEIGETN